MISSPVAGCLCVLSKHEASSGSNHSNLLRLNSFIPAQTTSSAAPPSLQPQSAAPAIPAPSPYQQQSSNAQPKTSAAAPWQQRDPQPQQSKPVPPALQIGPTPTKAPPQPLQAQTASVTGTFQPQPDHNNPTAAARPSAASNPSSQSKSQQGGSMAAGFASPGSQQGPDLSENTKASAWSR